MSYGTLQIEKMTTESGYSLGAGNASSFKNRIINGAMMVNQRGGVISASGQTNTYGVDRFAMRTTSGSAVVSMEQSTVAPTGFYNSLLCTVTTADASLASGDLTALHQKIEGVNVPDIAWGTASAKSVTISFQVRSSLTGTYGVGIQNDASNRSYPSTFTINSANTWESKTVTIPGDTTGTWNLGTTSTALYVFFSLSAGSDFTSGTTNAWNAADRRGASGQVNWCATNGNTFYITGVQLEVGTVDTSFDFRSFGTELQLCKRYFETSYNYGTAVGAVTVDGNVLWLTSQQWGVTSVPNGPIIQGSVVCEVAKRAVATIVGYSTNTGASGKFVLGSTNLDVTYANWLQQAPSTRHIGYPQNAGGAGFGNTDSVRFQWTASAEL